MAAITLYREAKDALGCDFAVIERLDVHAVIDSYRRLYAQGWHGEPPAPVMYQRFFDRGPDWVRAVIPLDRLNFQTEEESGAERVRRARQYAARGTPFPPGTASYGGRARQRRTGKAYVQDGNHRVLAAHFRGDCAIEMFMPEDEFYAVVEDARWRDDGAGEMRESAEPRVSPHEQADEIEITGYHFSHTRFDHFDLTHSSPTAVWGPGVYLSARKSELSGWSKHPGSPGYLYEVLITTSPDRVADITKPTTNEVYARIEQGLGRALPASTKDDGFFPFMTLERRYGTVADALRAFGFDVMIHQLNEGHGKHYLVVRPEALRIVSVQSNGAELRETVAAAPIGPIWYHLTDRAKFKLDPKFAPADNAIAIVDRSGRPGIYLGQSVEAWVNGFGYWRPFVVEFEVDPSVVNDPGIHGRYGGEMFVPSTSFDKLTIRRVIPIDAHAREEFGMPGWIELELGTAFDTGEPFPGRYPYIGLYRGYRYPGPDVRVMPAADANRLKRQLRQVKR